MESLTYENSYPGLPASAPIGHPHIISGGFHGETDITNLRAADAVATILYKRKPEALQSFLDLEYERFDFSCGAENERGLSYLVISRSGREVTVRNHEALTVNQLLNNVLSVWCLQPLRKHFIWVGVGCEARVQHQRSRCMGAALGESSDCWTG